MDVVTLKISELNNILLSISKRYKIDNDELLKCIDYSSLINMKAKVKPISPINYCIARTPNLKRCTRNRKNNSEYCASHHFKHPYGRIDQELNEELKPKKQKSIMIKLKPIIIDGVEYLIDNKKYLYVRENYDGKIKYRNIGIYNDTHNSIVPLSA
jgi:hypothetical protein